MYAIIILSAIAAGWCTLQAAHKREQEGQYMHKILSLKAIRCIEKGELQAVTAQQEQATHAAEQAEQQTVVYSAAAAVDVENEQQLVQKSATMQDISAKEHDHAVAMWHKVQDVDAQRLETLHQLEEEYQQEQELLRKLRNDKIHSGLCTWRGIASVCDMIGGVAALQDQANQVATQIHRDMLRLRQAERQEFLETIVAKALENKTERFKETAASLQRTAQWWHERAQQDQALAKRWNDAAIELEQEEELLEQRSEAYRQATEQMSQTIQQLLQSSLKAKRASQVYSVTSLVLAVLALMCLVGSVIPRLVTTVQSVLEWYQSPKTDETAVWCTISYSYLHLLIFLSTAVWCQDYVGHLDQFQADKRTVIVCYFSCVAAVTQSLLLHAIPYVIAEASDWNASDWKPLTVMMGKYFVLRVLCLMPLFAMELLFVWLSPLRTWALSPTGAHATVTILLLIVLYAAHLTWLGQATSSRSDQSTSSISHASFDDNYDHEVGSSPSLLSGNAQSASAATERTPLSDTHISATSTDIFPHAYLSGIESSSPTHLIQETDHCSQYSLHSDSPYYVNLREELYKLFLPFEMLTCFCMVLIVNIGLQNLFGELSMFAFALGLFLMTIVALAIQLRRSAVTRSTTTSFSEIVVPKILSV